MEMYDMLKELHIQSKIARAEKERIRMKKYNKEYYRKNKEKNHELITKCANRYYHANKEKIAKQRKIRYRAKVNYNKLLKELKNNKRFISNYCL